MGRRAKLDEETVAKLAEGALLGMTRDLQARYAGIGKSTLQRWLAQGRKAKTGRYRDLWDRLKEAEGLAAAQALSVIRQSKQWQAQAWFLERVHGYRKNGPAELAKEEALELADDETRVERVERQLREVRSANRSALAANSFQAFFAGQRLERDLASELELARLEGEQDDGLDDLDSPAFLEAFKSAATEWSDPMLEAVIQVYERRHGIRMLGVG